MTGAIILGPRLGRFRDARNGNLISNSSGDIEGEGTYE